MLHPVAFERHQNYGSKVPGLPSQKEVEPIKLRNLNLVSRETSGRGIKKEDETSILHAAPLEKPEPVWKSHKRSGRFSLDSHGLKDLGEIRNEFIPPSPSLEHTLALESEHNMAGTRSSEFQGTVNLDLSGLPRSYEESLDYPPFFRARDYESRLERDDYESIIHKMIDSELSNKRPVFQKELEFQELQKMVGKSDYLLYYVLGIDKLGFFELKNERDAFRGNLRDMYTSPLRYVENSSSGSSEVTDESGENSFLEEGLDIEHSTHSLV